MMKYTISLHSEDGEYRAECSELSVSSRGLSSSNALD